MTDDHDRTARGPTLRPRIALAAAATVVVVAVLAVIVFGLVPYPAVPTVQEQPEPLVTARLALLTYERDGPCLEVIDATGERQQVDCGSRIEGGDLRWLNDDEVVLGVGFEPDRRTAIDVMTGATRAIEAAEVPQDDTRSGADPRYGTLATSSDAGTVVLEVTRADGTTTTLLQLDGPERYSLYQPMWSEDGRWVVVQDSAERILVVPAGGGPARIWTEGLNGEIAVR